MARPFKQVTVKEVKELITKSFNNLIDKGKKSNGNVSVKTLIKARKTLVESL